MLWQRNKDGSFSVSGQGPMGAIAVEGDTREEAREAWMAVFGEQYERQERATAVAFHVERKGEDYKQMMREAHAYKGVF